MSGDAVVHAENLGKQYVLGHGPAVHDTLRDTLTSGARDVVRFLRGRGEGRSADDTIWALRDVSFEVRRGEVVGVIGRNGAGKSTLLKILSRITEPTTGFGWIRGRVGSLLEVGTGFHGELTGRENIFLSGAILGMRRREIAKKFDEIVDFAEIERFIDTPVKRYSSGMYLRLAFAVAAHLEPEILLVDEVLAVGDAAFQKKCLGKIGDVARQDRTVLFVSHNLVAVETLCGRALWLEDGRISQDGEASRVDLPVSAQHLHLGDRAILARSCPSAGRGRRSAASSLRPASRWRFHRIASPSILRSCSSASTTTTTPAGSLRVHLQLYDEKDLLLFNVGPPIEPDAGPPPLAAGVAPNGLPHSRRPAERRPPPSRRNNPAGQCSDHQACGGTGVRYPGLGRGPRRLV